MTTTMTTTLQREIPFNYTSADDRQVVTLLLGPEIWQKLVTLAGRRVTGRSSRQLMRFFGEIIVHRRNPFLFQALLDSPRRRRRFFKGLHASLDVIARRANDDPMTLEVMTTCRELAYAFERETAAAPDLRRRIRRVLGAVVGDDNVHFDPFTLVSHATDATDWRLFLPVAVVTPTRESQVARLLAAIGKLGLRAVPRGAGTGLTGGAVPLKPDCVIINTEKLDHILGIEGRELTRADGRSITAQVMRLEAGVVTEIAMEHAAARGLVFATDPTSAWACTIGGNIAENAGGKTSVLYGTAIDNLLSFKMAMPDGAEWMVHRRGHPLRKILPADEVRFEVTDKGGEIVRTVTLAGTELRKPGLWKDITNKALKGLPGVQKEGTDGVITSAEFVLYPEYERSVTLCLEFFGPDMDEASRVIQETTAAFPNEGAEVLRALEHFDAEYVRAIEYKTKTPRGEDPKAVLLVDLVGHSDAETARGVARIRDILSRHSNTFMHEAKDAAEAKRFWQDRKKLGAIARRTNAFKLNEDIVLPLAALAEFARFVDAVNVEEERFNQEAFVRRLREYLERAEPQEDPEWLRDKSESANELCERALSDLAAADEKKLRSLTVTRHLRRDLLTLFRGYSKLSAAIEAIHDHVRARLLVLATHMHAGDGNVHVNIPILSNDRPMMQRAETLVDRVMAKVMELGGVVSGEHGIGVTKLKYLEPERIAELSAYRREVDPEGRMNPGKLADLGVLDQIFTPSFNLLELEARILQHGSLEALASRIASCVRCGRCKTSCCVFHPARGLFFHPRNKNLAIGSLIEALLYDAQRSTSFELLRHLEEVADHCTICHKCQKPCPVSIDTGDVSVLERDLLMARRYKHVAAVTRLTLNYLESQSRLFNKLVRTFVLRLGGGVQRLAARLLAPLQLVRPLARLYPLQMLRSPMPPADVGTLRDYLPACQTNQVLVIPPEGEAAGTVFYFPGCGSERMFSRVSRAAISVLLSLKYRVVLPPPFVCCGFPAHANARTIQHGRLVLKDTILFTQIKDTLSYLHFDACVVTCGTCKEALGEMTAGAIFDCDVIDVAAFAAERGLLGVGGGDFLYHAPCHDSLDGKAAQVLGKVGGYRLHAVPHCCSEAGTLALSRPDISDSMRDRKAEAIREATAQRGEGRGRAVMLTNCPSCLQGLGRNAHLKIRPRHIAVQLAEALGGKEWHAKLQAQAARAEVVDL